MKVIIASDSHRRNDRLRVLEEMYPAALLVHSGDFQEDPGNLITGFPCLATTTQTSVRDWRRSALCSLKDTVCFCSTDIRSAAEEGWKNWHTWLQKKAVIQ